MSVNNSLLTVNKKPVASALPLPPPVIIDGSESEEEADVPPPPPPQPPRTFYA
jgi:hypothetical protein